jgi:hypothetical protein
MFHLLFLLHIFASICIGLDAYRKGRSAIRWSLATFLIPYGILITWPLIVLLPPVKPAITDQSIP